MKFKDIFSALKPLAGVVATLNPLVGAALGAVNLFLPDGEKLPLDATGQQVSDAANALPPEQKASLMEKRIDLEIAQEEGWTERYTAMVTADGQSTRPKIAWAMAQLLVAVTLGFVVLLFYVAATDGIAAALNGDLWLVFGAITSIPGGLLAKYFGELRKEQANRLEVKPASPLAALGSLFGGGK